MWQYQVVEYDTRTGTCRTNKTGHAASILTFTQVALASSSELRGSCVGQVVGAQAADDSSLVFRAASSWPSQRGGSDHDRIAGSIDGRYEPLGRCAIFLSLLGAALHCRPGLLCCRQHSRAWGLAAGTRECPSTPRARHPLVLTPHANDGRDGALVGKQLKIFFQNSNQMIRRRSKPPDLPHEELPRRKKPSIRI
jgi:hypothetical protein